MKKTGFAYFVEHPRTVEDLRAPNQPDQAREYEIVKTVTLPKIDYENFVSDMVADRWFLEANASICAVEHMIRCLLIRQHGMGGGLLIVPNGAYVGLAALAKVR